MPHKSEHPRQGNELADDEPVDQNAVETSAQGNLSPAQICRWAELIACGGAPLFPIVGHIKQNELLDQVARLRRSRLLNFIARTIAKDIHRSRKP